MPPCPDRAVLARVVCSEVSCRAGRSYPEQVKQRVQQSAVIARVLHARMAEQLSAGLAAGELDLEALLTSVDLDERTHSPEHVTFLAARGDLTSPAHEPLYTTPATCLCSVASVVDDAAVYYVAWIFP
eukprot:TRINITY_DN53133_c0_g1_i1.p2 TRINITY_DN53133_c0_g1~~TRINITY_DN53133_c0_g1_i1.p2  ORF type:complete len:148 (+),score=53.80 TRINITY_DN53133_c0_g1_i1:63-446(+)